MKRLISLTVNGEEHQVAAEPHRTLLELLREELGLTGTKESCDGGECGTCTVLLDGRPVVSCLVLAVNANGHEVTTIEGISAGESLHPLQEAFAELGGSQCGYCTPGMIVASKALLDARPDPTEQEVREAISGHICRCTGYVKIVASVREAAERMRSQA